MLRVPRRWRLRLIKAVLLAQPHFSLQPLKVIELVVDRHELSESRR